MYYKVVYRNLAKQTLHSSNEGIKTLNFNIEYKVNEWMTPPIKDSGLFIFSSLDTAKEFANRDTYEFPNLEVWECQVRNPRKQLNFIQFFGFCNVVDEFWQKYSELKAKHKKRFNVKIHGFARSIPYSDVYIASAVKLVKKV